MTLTEQLTDYVHAAFTGLWILTAEPDEAERELLHLAHQQQWQVAVWDVARGLRLPGSNATPEVGAGEPLAALRSLANLATANGTAILVLHNFHRFLSNAEVLQTTFQQLVAGKQQRTFLVVLSSVLQIPTELEKLFVVLEHPLPDRQLLLQIARELTNDQPDDLPQGDHLERLLDAAAGLTRYEAEGAFSLSLTRHDTLQPDVVQDLKAQALKKNNLLTLHRGNEFFSDLGGLANVKEFCTKALRSGRTVQARGILLLGVPGTGKSALAKALGNEVGRPTLLLDLGSLYGSLVGSTEANIRQALRIAEAMAPAILFLDELDKSLGGLGSNADSGVSTRLFGTLLTWLAERTADVFVIGTANDISRLPPEFTRAERMDAVFFLDTPAAQEKDAIWTRYRSTYGIPATQQRPDDSGWTGAEVKACCRLATLLDVTLTQAAQHIVPVAVTAAEAMEKLRTWANGRCLDAAQPGIYQREGATPARPARRLRRDTSSN